MGPLQWGFAVEDRDWRKPPAGICKGKPICSSGSSLLCHSATVAREPNTSLWWGPSWASRVLSSIPDLQHET